MPSTSIFSFPVTLTPNLRTTLSLTVTFPSKIFEYMLSGTPVITTRLNGFNSEYYDTMYFVEDNTVNELVTGIKMVLSQTPEQLRQKAYSAYRLVLQLVLIKILGRQEWI